MGHAMRRLDASLSLILENGRNGSTSRILVEAGLSGDFSYRNLLRQSISDSSSDSPEWQNLHLSFLSPGRRSSVFFTP